MRARPSAATRCRRTDAVRRLAGIAGCLAELLREASVGDQLRYQAATFQVSTSQPL